MSYPTIEQVKHYLGIDTSAEDALLTELLMRSVSIIESSTGRTFTAKRDTRFFGVDRIYGRDLMFWDNDLLEVEELLNGDGEAIEAKYFVLLPRNESPKWGVRLKSGAHWDVPIDGEIAVTGLWGYSETPPDDIVHATVRLTAFLYRQKDTSADVDRPIVTGDGVTIMPTGLPSDVKALVSKYRKVVP